MTGITGGPLPLRASHSKRTFVRPSAREQSPRIDRESSKADNLLELHP
jgi:hypothetical protein